MQNREMEDKLEDEYRHVSTIWKQGIEQLNTSSPPVIEYDLHGCDDDGDGDDEEDGEADVQVLSDPGKLLSVRNVRFI